MQTVPRKPATVPYRNELLTYGTQLTIRVNELSGIDTGGA